MNSRLGLKLAVAFATFAGLAATPLVSVAHAADFNIWYVNPLPNTPDWGRSGKEFVDGAAANGYKATLVGPDKIDIPTMISEIEQAISDNADAIITCSLDHNAFKDVFDKAKAKGIIVAALGCTDPNASFSVGTGGEQFGRAAADIIAQQTGNKANVGIVATNQTEPNQVAQVTGFRDEVKDKFPNLKEVVWESDNSDAGVAAQKMSAMVAAYPEMDYMWIIEGAAPGAVPAALGEAGNKPGDIKVLAVDAQAATLKAIQDGWISGTLNQCWFDTSVNVAKLMMDIKSKGVTPQPFYVIPVDAVTKDSLPYKGCPTDNIDKPFAR